MRFYTKAHYPTPGRISTSPWRDLKGRGVNATLAATGRFLFGLGVKNFQEKYFFVIFKDYWNVHRSWRSAFPFPWNQFIRASGLVHCVCDQVEFLKDVIFFKTPPVIPVFFFFLYGRMCHSSETYYALTKH